MAMGGREAAKAGVQKREAKSARKKHRQTFPKVFARAGRLGMIAGMRCTRRACLVGMVLAMWGGWPGGGSIGGSRSSLAAEAPAKVAKDAAVVHVDGAGAGRLLSTNKNVFVLDVRTSKEFARGHIQGATNIDFNGSKFSAEIGKLDRNQTFLVHCAGGGRSTKSLEVFKKLGFRSLIHLDGGLAAWEEAGQPVTPAK